MAFLALVSQLFSPGTNNAAGFSLRNCAGPFQPSVRIVFLLLQFKIRLGNNSPNKDSIRITHTSALRCGLNNAVAFVFNLLVCIVDFGKRISMRDQCFGMAQ